LNQPLSKFPPMNFGNMPADGGYLLFTDEEKVSFIEKEPNSEKWFKELISAHEFLNGKKRYCLWLEDLQHFAKNLKPQSFQNQGIALFFLYFSQVRGLSRTLK
jgi:hypothetical protein